MTEPPDFLNIAWTSFAEGPPYQFIPVSRQEPSTIRRIAAAT
ncbi:MAG: hypothetical protein ABI353_23740 [Isosphaeraceae bacterium]